MSHQRRWSRKRRRARTTLPYGSIMQEVATFTLPSDSGTRDALATYPLLYTGAPGSLLSRSTGVKLLNILQLEYTGFPRVLANSLTRVDLVNCRSVSFIFKWLVHFLFLIEIWIGASTGESSAFGELPTNCSFINTARCAAGVVVRLWFF